MSILGPTPACLPQDPAGLEKEFTFRKVVVVGSSLELQSTWKRGAHLRPALQPKILPKPLTSRIGRAREETPSRLLLRLPPISMLSIRLQFCLCLRQVQSQLNSTPTVHSPPAPLRSLNPTIPSPA